MEGAQNEEDILVIQMMGEFSIRRGERVFDEKQGRAKKVITLIEYLIANRHTCVSQERLLEAIWDEEEFDNPLNTLKNLVYRARTLLKILNKPGIVKYDFILHEGNSYVWNNTLPCMVDTERIEELYKKSERVESGGEEQMKCYYEIQSLYHGEFLPKALYYEWALNRNAYFQTLYANASKGLMKILKQRQMYEHLTTVCEKYNLYYPFDEDVHILLLEAYAKTGQMKRMIEHYQNMTAMFFHEFGVPLSKTAVKTYKELTKSIHRIEMDINQIKGELVESQIKEGAFFCDYDTFRYIYQLEARSMLRNGAPVYFGLFTLTDSDGDILPKILIKKGMPFLKEILSKHLRKGDVVSNYSSVQWIILLPYTTYENGLKVLERVKKSFFENPITLRMKLQTSLSGIKPIK